MLFTIAIPTYNNAQTIQSAIESSINQTYQEDYEILVLNNNSTDNTSDILCKYKDEIRVFKNRVTVSMYENHNLCLEYANGDYIVFCHSDDQLLPDALKKYADILKKRNYPERFVLWGRSMFRDYFINWKRGGFHLNEIASGIKSLDIVLWGGLTPSGTCYSRESFFNVGGFLVSYNKLAPSDYATMWKLVLLHFEFEMSDRIFFIRDNANTASGHLYNNKNINESIIEIIRVFRNEMGDNSLKLITNHIKESDFFYVKLLYLLLTNGFVNKSLIKNKTIRFFLRNPTLLRDTEALKLFLKVL